MCSYQRKSGWRKRKLLFIGFFVLVLLLLSGGVMLLWNSLLPEIANVKKINYWQALGLLVLCRILFGNFGFGANMQRPFYGPARQHLRGKWLQMSEEERTVFKEEWKKRCEQRK
jgi:hypothetical protein